MIAPRRRGGARPARRLARRLAVSAAVVAACCGCEALWPPVDSGPAAATGASAVAPAPAGSFVAAPTGSAVSGEVVRLGQDLAALQARIASHNTRLQQIRSQIIAESESYHGTVAAINARLQIGTTADNPVLIEQAAAARRNLDGLGAGVAALTDLRSAVAADGGAARDLSTSARSALARPGAVDADHRQLAIIQDEADRSTVLIDRLLTDISADIRRQSRFLAGEPATLDRIAAQIRAGDIAAGGNGGSGAPLVVIRFYRDDVAFQDALYGAVGEVLDRDPEAAFDIVAVAPERGDPARSRRHADAVERSLVRFGLPPSRLRTTAEVSAAASTSEVRLFVR